MAENNAINIDFHSHILPGIDDGATDTDVSIGQLTRLKKQGVDKVFLTSHFDFRKERPKTFLDRRAEAYEKLMKVYDPETMPETFLGAEIYMVRGIEECDYSPLELENTGYILLEFPREQFGTWMFDLIETLLFERKMKVIIAHVNRVLAAYKKDVCKNLFDYNDLIFQINTEAFHGVFSSDPFKGYDISGLKFILGTDTHDLGHRAPDFDKALKKLEGRSLSYLRDSIEYTTAMMNRRIEKNRNK